MHQVGDDKTEKGQAETRRVVVRALQNKGVGWNSVMTDLSSCESLAREFSPSFGQTPQFSLLKRLWGPTATVTVRNDSRIIDGAGHWPNFLGNCRAF
jgi:hypothetical protein